ncbi:MAG: hypothetical protein BGO11_12465 [Solirubrobacterales bacterium 70-9]|nr:MAG: hypothetical protein BGO11_12465 [Solirubrobacterales bacterium 70-9]
MTALELDAAKVRVMKSAQKQSGMFAKKKGSLMKSRFALIAVLALGVFMSGTGASLAVSGFADSGSAGQTQYPQHNSHNNGKHVVEAADGGGSKCTEGSSGNGASSGSGAENCNEPEVAAVEAQAVEQTAVTGSSSSLPFTGLAAIPVLIVGLGLLAAGVAMRFRRRDDAV